MISKLFQRSVAGVAWGGFITFIALTVLMLNDINPHISTIWLYMLASLVLGIYFGLATVIFEHESWSPLKQTIIHFSLSVTIYFIFALSLEWVPFTFVAIVNSFLFFTIIYAIFWFGFSLYYKRIANSLNESLKK